MHWYVFLKKWLAFTVIFGEASWIRFPHKRVDKIISMEKQDEEVVYRMIAITEL